MPPTTATERDLWNRGYRLVAGVDEAGRGCLAGPVVAAAVILPPEAAIPGLDDSKKLSPARREALLSTIQAEAVALGVGLCSPAEIDRMNILWAALEAMRRAVAALTPSPDYLLIDGNRCFPHCTYPFTTLVRGDARSRSIAAASIVAKTTRDRIMHDLDHHFPQYGWRRNAGYPTRDHYEALAAHGPTPLHRRSFRLSRD
ncbi:ribonuclease HII [Rhodocaloribacter litoris]|uniref:ribonuclease HII n=1 Tax=Rhodocaloribacter litoris TaxID=2558931 RepID=UPI00141E1059|nr:ribonuclease HII [Rhodocaloribacter litoris]QXD16233.1 ribonuclease HII [Rhodocaloribacter litoris]GIV60728.1 MAG: ribonuclease HII [Rhodothermaceae bacterium]